MEPLSTKAFDITKSVTKTDAIQAAAEEMFLVMVSFLQIEAA